MAIANLPSRITNGVGVAAVVLLTAQSSEVTSLRVRIAVKTVPISVVTIENRTAVPIGWRLELIGSDGQVSTVPATTASQTFHQIDPSLCLPQPGTRCRIHLMGDNGAIVRAARLTYVQTVQGDREGDQAVLDELERQRLKALAANEYWTNVLERAPSELAALESFLAARVDESLERGFAGDPFSGQWLDDGVYGCTSDYLLKAVRAQQLQLASTHQYLQIPPRQQTPGVVTSATATLDAQETAGEVVAYITNDRDVAADAWDLAFFGQSEARYPIKTFTSRGGGDPRAVQSLRPLAPHETRELLVMSPTPDEGVVPQPRAALRMAIFEDGRGEGSAELRQQILADRARDGVDVDYWRLALLGARDLPSKAAIVDLRNRLRTRKCQTTGYFHTDRSASTVAALTSKVQTSPDRKIELIDKQIAAFEVERQAIAKFVNR